MIYKMSKVSFSLMGGDKEEVIKRLNERLCHPYIKQDSIVAEDKRTGERQRIKVEPLMVITDIIIN